MLESILNEIGAASVKASSYFANLDMPPIDFSNLKKYALYSGIALAGLIVFVGYALVKKRDGGNDDNFLQ